MRLFWAAITRESSMKLLLALFTISFGSFAVAQEVEIKHTGEFRARYLNHRNTTAQDLTSTGKDADSTDIDHRFKLNILAQKGESLQAGLTVLHASGWGEANDPTTGTQIPSSRDDFDEDNMLFVSRAWGSWKANDSISFKFGRVGLEFADGSVFSENDWEQFPVSHDGVIGFWDINLGKFTLFAAKNRERGIGTLDNDAEENMYGLAFDFKNVPAFIKIFNVQFVQITQDEVGSPDSSKDNRQHLGLAVGGDTFGLIYKVAGAYQLGKTSGTASGTAFEADNNAWMYDVLGGYQLSSLRNFKITAGYHQDSGDKDLSDNRKNEAYNSLFYDRHNNSGLMDVLRWGNLTYWSVNTSISLLDDLDGGVSYLNFTRTSSGGNVTPTVYGPNYSLSDVTTNDELGSEVDVWVNKTYSSTGFQIGGRFGIFMPGEAIKQMPLAQMRDRSIYQWMLQGALSF